MQSAVSVRVTGVVQGVGFRPFVHRVATSLGVAGWVRNGDDGVHIHAEGPAGVLDRFVEVLRADPPPAAQIASFAVAPATVEGMDAFGILRSTSGSTPTVRISPDLPVCDACLRELFDPSDRRFGYPYINCTNCGPRYSIVLELPYDRPRTTMRDWPLCEECRREYEDPADRRFHAQPTACHDCGPAYRLHRNGLYEDDGDPIAAAADLLAAGAIVALKGIGGYHLACDANGAHAVEALRERKYRKERPFAVMARDLETARELVELDRAGVRLLSSIERPIVLAPAKQLLPGVAPGNRELGVMLPYTPLHHLLFAAGAPRVLVMTSANRSSEPIAYADEDALASLSGIADAFLVGERPIARRVDDSVVRFAPGGPAVLRRSRGFSPGAVGSLPAKWPILALGADLKNTITLVVDGQAFCSQHIGDLEHFSVRESLRATVHDLCTMYGIHFDALTIVHDLHPDYRTTELAAALGSERVLAVQHHRAHAASVVAEREAWSTPVLSFVFDGMGYGDDGSIWGGEVFTGSLDGEFRRVAHLRTAMLPGGDAAARHPVQAAAGFLDGFDTLSFAEPPFSFPARFEQAKALIATGTRTFATSSMGRLFDTVAALLGFVREQTFEGQAAMWLEHLARDCDAPRPYAFELRDGEFDYRPVLQNVVADRIAGRSAPEIARAFHGAVAAAVVGVSRELGSGPVVASGGVFQNRLLVEDISAQLGEKLWLNRKVPPNDGGISFGQAAWAAAQLG